MSIASLAKDPQYMSYLGSLEQKYGLPSGILATQQQAESNFNPSAVSPAGAQGIAQFMPPTAKQYGVDPMDPMQAADGQARMLRDLGSKYNGDIPSVLAAYNWGSGNLDRKGMENAPAETTSYIAKIMGALPSGPDPSGQDAPGALSRMASAVGQAIIPSAQAGELQPGDTAQRDPFEQIANAERDAYAGAAAPANDNPYAQLPDDQLLAEAQKAGLKVEQPQQDFSKMSDEQLLAAAEQSGLKVEKPAPQQTVERMLGRTARIGAEGVTMIPNIIGDAANAAINLGSMGINKVAGTDIPMLAYPGQTTQSALDKLGLPRAETGIEKGVDVLGQAMTGLASPGNSILEAGAKAIAPVAESAIGKVAAMFGKDTGKAVAPAEETGTQIALPQIGTQQSILTKEQKLGHDLIRQTIGDADIGMAAQKLAEAQKSGQPMVAVDILANEKGGVLTSGKNTLGMVRALASLPGETAEMAGQVAQRAAQAPERIGGALDKLLSKNDYYGSIAKAEEFKKGSNPFYQSAYKANQNIESPLINRILKTPAGKQALSDVRDQMQNQMTLLSKPDPELTKQAKDVGLLLNGKKGVGKGLKLETLDRVKQALDAMAQKTYKAAEMGNAKKAEAKGYSDLAKSLRGELDDLDVTAKAGPNSLKPEGGDYARGRAMNATGQQINEALQQGRDFMKMDAEEISAYMKDKHTTLPQKEAFSKGTRRALQDMIERLSDNRTPLNTIWKESIRSRLRALGGNERDWQQFSKFMENEKAMNRTDNMLSGGSMTNPNANYQSQISPKSVDARSALKAFANPKGATIDAAVDLLDKALQSRVTKSSQATGKEIMRHLLADDPRVLEQFSKLKPKGAK